MCSGENQLQPGHTIEYANFNLLLLGEIIEQVTGREAVQPSS